ncbi:MAG: VOC family protein [Acidobacteriota bacterium]
MDEKTPRMTRRELLRLGATASPVLLCRPFFALAADPVADVDHIIWAVPDLEAGIQYIQQKTGVGAIMGGVHPERGTRNALISLGKRHYLEILSVDPAQPGAKEEMAEIVKGLAEPRILGWAARTESLAEVEERIRGAGLESSGVVAGSRKKPDGTTLRWRTLVVRGHDGTVVPFLIQWDRASPHPSQDSPRGCTLRELRLEHPDPDKMNRFLEAMGLSPRVMKGNRPKITAILDTPKGRVELT